jgi:hypothetical protein
MNNPDHNSESSETIFLVKILKFFDVDLGSGIRDGKNFDPGSGMSGSETLVHSELFFYMGGGEFFL